MSKKDRKLPKRTWLSFLVIFLLVPALVLLGGYLGGRSYYLIGVCVIVLTSVLFFLVFEQRQPQAREVVTLAVLCALAVASRAAFMAIPHFKPMMAIVMIAGFAYGPEAGFLVGAMTAFASNFIFGQGPWTPWQMFGYGMGGFLAGVAFRLKLLPQKKMPMAIFGFAVIFCIVGPILDTSSVFTMLTDINWASALTIYASGVPVNIIHGVATFVTLLLLGEPMLEKLDRIKLKYGMMEDGDDAF